MTDEQIDDTKPSLMVSFFLEREIFREALSDFVNPRPKPYEGDKKFGPITMQWVRNSKKNKEKMANIGKMEDLIDFLLRPLSNEMDELKKRAAKGLVEKGLRKFDNRSLDRHILGELSNRLYKKENWRIRYDEANYYAGMNYLFDAYLISRDVECL
ncbi:hypothetical protein N9A51_01290 [Pseudomonadales bacterium]|nr:hypothetical protein [Pseudomonadales bacterium]